MQFMHVEEAVQLMKMEYAESPTLALTAWQAQHLWNLSEEWCDRALRFLVGSSFLMRTPDGAYVRRENAPVGLDSTDNSQRVSVSRID